MEKTLGAVNKFFEGYCHAFDHGDLNHILQCFHYPCLIIFGPQVTAFQSKEELLVGLKKLLAIYQQKGYQKSSFKVEALSFFNPSHYLVTLHWTILRNEGKAVEFAITYQIIEKDQQLKIVVVTNLEEKL
jgi:hypothetical protein